MTANWLYRLWHGLGGGTEGRAEYRWRPYFGRTLPSWRQLRLLPRILTANERRLALGLIILVLVSVLALGWRQYEQRTELRPKVGGEYSEGVIGHPRTANPLLATSDADIDLTFLTHRGLFRTDAHGVITPDLAQSWNLSLDGKTYLITLQPGLLWSDGQPLTAADVVFTFASVKQAKLGSPLAASFRDVSVTAQDDGLTVNFTLKEPYVPFLYALTVGLIPEHIWQGVPYELWLQAEANLRPVGTGPWRFSALTRDGVGNLRSYLLEPNRFSHEPQPYFKKLTLRFYPDILSALEALKQGTISGLGDLSRRQAASLNPQRFVVYDITLPQYTAIFYNPETNELLKNVAIRQGLSYGINRPLLIQTALSGQAQPATGPFAFGEVKTRTVAQAITFDPTKSAQLFEAAGFTRSNSTGFFAKEDAALKITLTFVDNEEAWRVAEEVKRQWQAIGVSVNLQASLAASLQTDIIKTRNYQALLASEVVGLDPDPYPFWHSSQVNQGLNLAQFKNHEADQLLVEARQTPDAASRLEKYVRFQDILRQASPATFLYSLSYSYAQSYAVKGFDRLIMGQPAERFWDTAYWYSRTSRNWSQN